MGLRNCLPRGCSVVTGMIACRGRCALVRMPERGYAGKWRQLGESVKLPGVESVLTSVS